MPSSLHPLTWAIVALFALGTACTKAAEPGHEGHDHGHEHGDEGHGKAHALGELTLAGSRYAVTTHGEIEAGHEGVLTIALAEGSAPTAIRAWVGIESGKGAVKGLLGKTDAGWHGHIEVAATLPEGAAVWIETEAADGSTARGSVAIPAEEHGHEHGHEGHDHKH